MTDDEIRAALLNARGAPAPFSIDGHVVISRERVAADADEIDRWVVEQSGWIETVPGYESQALGGGMWQRGPSTKPSRWYVVPAPAVGL
jgi:hypothetical protein